MLIEMLARTPDLRTMPAADARIARSLRLWVMARKGGGCGLGAVAGSLGSHRAAAHFHLLLEEVGAAWPDPFCVSPPCCPRLSHDEALFVEMLGHAAAGDRPGFDRLLSDLLPEDARERLFFSASVLSPLLAD